jgi:hypothetical protein
MCSVANTANANGTGPATYDQWPVIAILCEDFAAMASERGRGVCFLLFLPWVFLQRVVEILTSVSIMRFTRKYSLEGVAIGLTSAKARPSGSVLPLIEKAGARNTVASV